MTEKGYAPRDLPHGLLTPSRFVDESICIGDDVVMTIVRIRGDKVRESSGQRFYPASGE